MKTDRNYKFEVSVSDDSYTNKEISGAMIGSGKNEENRKIRVKYGFKPNRGIGYRRITTTAENLMIMLINGKVMCNLFNDEYIDKNGDLKIQRRKDGTFGSFVKRDINFYGSYTIGVDIDETQYKSVSDFIDKLTLKPTFYYTSYSHLQPEKGVRFRMIYVVDDLIKYPLNFRYVAWCLNKIIERDTQEPIKDDCNIRCSQYFNGTNINTSGINVEYGCSNIIYTVSDFGCTKYGFYNFLQHKAYYRSTNKKREEYINKILYTLHTNTTISINPTQHDYSFKMNNQYTINEDWQKEGQLNQVEEKAIIDYSQVDLSDMNFDDEPEFDDWDTLLSWYYINRPECIRVKFQDKYNFIYRVDNGNWIDGLYQKVDENYFMLFWNNEQKKDGEKRGKTLFQRMLFRRIINPSIEHNELLYNAMIDVLMFIDNSDNKFNVDHLKKEVINAMAIEIDDIEQQNKTSLEWLRANTKPKGGYIYSSKDVMQEAHFSIIDTYYDSTLSISENFNNNPTYSIRTLYRYCSSRNINPSQKVSDQDLQILIHTSQSIRWNVKNLKDNYNIKVSKDRVQRIINQLLNNNNLTTTTNTNTTTTNNTNDYSLNDYNLYTINEDWQKEGQFNTTTNTEQYTINQSWQKNEQLNSTIENEVKSDSEIEKTQSEPLETLNSEIKFNIELPNFFNNNDTMDRTLDDVIESIKSLSTIPSTSKFNIETPKYDASAFLSGANFGHIWK